MQLPLRLLPLLLFLPCIYLSAQTPSFTLPDTVCTNNPVKITNTSAGGTTYYWNFCVADISKTPEATNLGNIGGAFSYPVFIDIDSLNNHYYGFLVNNYQGGLVRLDFGNSMLNIPVPTNMGNFGGIIPPGAGSEGIQIVHNNGKWYIIIVGWDLATTGNPPKIIQIDFGTDLGNPSPVATDWGNLGNLAQPIDLYIFNENSHWYGFTVNATNSTVTRFDFGTSFDTPPTATNMGNLGGLLNYPTGICAVNDGGNWHVFITNAYTSLVRLDFGNSLLSTPVAVSLGDPGNTLHQPRDIAVMKFCDQTFGYLVNGDPGYNDFVQLDFKNDLTSIPVAISLGNIGNFNFPHSLSKIFRVGADLYCFIPNVSNNTLTRLKFSGCTNSSLPNSALKDPPDISYSLPGTYNVNLIMDDGLATASTFCKTVTVMPPPRFSLGNDTSFCQGDSLTLMYKGQNLIYSWQDGSSADSLVVRSSGQYQLTVNTSYGCSAGDDVMVQAKSLPTLTTLPDTSLCAGSSILLKTSVQNSDSLRWAPSGGLSNSSAVSPLASPLASTRYIVSAFHQACPVMDTIMVSVLDTPAITVSPDTVICKGGMAQLRVTGADTYLWSPANGLSDPALPDPAASPDISRYYQVLATGANLCTSKDSVLISVKKPDIFNLSPLNAKLCTGDSVLLKADGADLSLGDGYKWLTDISPQDPFSPSVRVAPSSSVFYQVVGYDKVCDRTDTLTADITVIPKPQVTVTKSNDIDCTLGEATLSASGGATYAWSPAQGLSDSLISNPVARTDSNTVYTVEVTDSNGCSATGSITLFVTKSGGSIGYPVSNAFTPNGDGNNDCFGIKYWGYIGEFELSIFNRWGGRVFYSQNPGQCWDGTFKGRPQPSGTFVYMIRAKTLCGVVSRKGTVLLVR
ncbi:MAG TPA: gliding motility-associated C-terminal domain-containing protein [Puia sp.]|nr:gliding motility-associated C-terminal domain-containing protein [Puia sp.]